MATTNQRNRQGGKGKADGMQQKGQHLAEEATGKLAEMRDQVTGYVSQGTEQFGQMTRGHEGQAVMIALAAGFGVGLVIGMSLAGAHQRPKSWSDRIVAEGLGRKLLSRVERMMPEMVTEHFGR
jgi:hypothetical protein